MSYQFIQKLLHSDVDIIGDVHGEIDALKDLIGVLGYDEDGKHDQGRKLIFVGDLCDRGIDSIAVIAFVKHLVEQGNAQCILGNHELNLLVESHREGNGWFFGSPHEDDHKIFSTSSKSADLTDRQWILDFISTLPLALESDQLRVVHACWSDKLIESLKSHHFNSVVEANTFFQDEIDIYLKESGMNEKARIESANYDLKNPQANIPLLEHTAQKDIYEQMSNPVRVITSGAERLANVPFYAGGKWRMVERHLWWNEYDESIPVVIGHYWRSFNRTQVHKGLFSDIDPLTWFGKCQNVFCVDYSVGKRYIDRQQQRAYSSQLNALRFPENVVMTEFGEQFQTEYFES